MSLRTILEQLCDFDTALLANTIGCLDPTRPAEWYLGGSIRSLTPELGPTAGVAVTIKLDSSTPKETGNMDPYYEQLEQMSQRDVPIVWVVQAVGARPDHECVLGDGMAKCLHVVGCTGVVTNGGVRDMPGIRSTGLAIYAKGTVIHHEPYAYSAPNEPVEIGGVTIHSGDLLHGSAEGVIKIPSGCIDQLVDAATRMRAVEHEVHANWRRTDLSPAEKRKLAEEVLARNGFAR